MSYRTRYFFTADEHYGHEKILKYCNRPFKTIGDHDEQLIKNHNEVVTPHDIVIHLGDFTFYPKRQVADIITRLNGHHTFLRGSHDRWLSQSAAVLWERCIDNQHIVCCHYPMLQWPRSHYGAWQLFGHSHGASAHHNPATQMDVGVDTHNYYPYSLDEIKQRLRGLVYNQQEISS